MKNDKEYTQCLDLLGTRILVQLVGEAETCFTVRCLEQSELIPQIRYLESDDN